MILVIPLFGGISALVLYILFLSGILESPLFPEFRLPEFVEGAGRENIRQFLTETYPVSGEDTAKLLFWSFVAGFSERFVPQIITRIVDDDKPKS